MAARIVLKALYTARLARLDLMWTVNLLAREVTRWTAACDRRLHRLISYMNCTEDWCQGCYVGDYASDIHLMLFSDASFAGDLKDSKSTSGGILVLVGPNTFLPIAWLVRSRVLCRIQLPKLKLFPWTLVFVWRVCLLCTFGTL